MDNLLLNKLKKKYIKKARNLKQEKYYGHIEYKLHLHRISERKIYKYAAQMQFRLEEGRGKAIYNIGYTDCGIPAGLKQTSLLSSFNSIQQITKLVSAKIMACKIFEGKRGYVLNIFLICKDMPVAHF